MPTEAELLEQLLPLCRMIALDHAGRWEREDLEQEAAIGALQAVRRGRGPSDGAVVVFLSIEAGDDEAETWRATIDPGYELVEALADYRAAA